MRKLLISDDGRNMRLLRKGRGHFLWGRKISISNSPCTLVVFWPEGMNTPVRRMVFEELIFSRYPAMREVYDPTDAAEVTLFFHHAPESVAYTDGQSIFVSIGHMDAPPDDCNLLTHELSHVVQNGHYTETIPSLSVLTEGLADYARAKYSCPRDDNWSLYARQEGQSYMDSYGATGGFLNWISQTTESASPALMVGKAHFMYLDDQLWISCAFSL